ncbi:MAG: hypothetical protein KME27_26460 [Lyngbya sp. HA4199-MV5]|jgi:hypothetical protein|nr:hypothetical protein [Lyngbya sp. HA4199-MV5]
MQFLSEQFDNRTKFLAGFLVWTLCLGLTTLSVQHSCNPMIGSPSPECGAIVQKSDGAKTSDSNKQQKERKNHPSKTNHPLPDPPTKEKSGDSKPPSKPVQKTTSPKCGKSFIPIVAGAGSAAAAGAGASALASAGVISATITVGSAVIAAPVTMAVAAGILVFLAVRSLTGGTC